MPESPAMVPIATNRINRERTEHTAEEVRESYVANVDERASGMEPEESFRSTESPRNESLSRKSRVHGPYPDVFTSREFVPGKISIAGSWTVNVGYWAFSSALPFPSSSIVRSALLVYVLSLVRGNGNWFARSIRRACAIKRE